MFFKRNWIVGILLLVGSFVYGAVYELPQHLLYTQQQLVKLQSPIILKDQVSYLPIGDWVQFYGGKFTYSRRTDRYMGAMEKPDKFTFELTPNDVQVTVNQKVQTLTLPILHYRNQMYVPISSFFALLGYEVVVEGKQIFLKKGLVKEDVVPVASLKSEFKPEIKSDIKPEIKPVAAVKPAVAPVVPVPPVAAAGKAVVTAVTPVAVPPVSAKSAVSAVVPVSSASSAGTSQAVPKTQSLGPALVEELSGQTTIHLHGFKKGKSESSKLPKKSDVTDLHVQFGLNPYSLNDNYLFKGRLLYVNLEEVLSKEGFKVNASADTLTLKFRDVTAVFGLTATAIPIKSQKGVRTFPFKQALIVEGGKRYIAFEAFLEVFQFGIFWDSTTQTVQLLNKLQFLQLSAEDGGYVLNLFASAPLMSADPIASNLRRGFYIDIPFSQIDEPETVQFPLETPLANASIQQKDDTTVRLTLFFRKTIGYFPLETIKQGGEIRFHTSMVSLTEKTKDGHQVVTIKANGPFKYTPWFDPAKKKVIIDIPQTVTQLPLFFRSDTVDYSEIRTSQLTLHPPQTRIVFDIKQAEMPVFSHVDEQTLVITFGVPKKEEPQVEPARTVVIEPADKPLQKLPISVEKKDAVAEVQSPQKTEEDTQILSENEGLIKEEKPKKRVKSSKSQALKGKIIVIDAGHGGSDPGAVVYRRDYEKNYTLDIAKRLAIALEEDGARVILTRKSDRTVSLKSRSFIANKNRADLMISIHINSFRKPHIHGTETYYFKYGDKRVATLLQEEMAEALGLKDNGIKRSRMYVLRNTKMPAALVEPLFITNDAEYKLLKSPDYRQKIADALRRGTQQYFLSK